MFKKKLGFLLGVMVFLSLIGFFVCFAAGGNKKLNKDGEFLLVTSFYPMYILAENLTAGATDVTVFNLTENQTGCLHDYQLFPEDMKLLSRADAFLVNGAGMELFLEKVVESNGELPVIEASHGISLLAGEEHHHGEDTGHETEHEEAEGESGHEEHHHVHAENGHVWMDVKRYRMQLFNITEELQRMLPKQADTLSRAAADYDGKLKVLEEGVNDLKGHTEGNYVVIFHEAFAYLAESLGMEVLKSFSLDANNLPSAGEITEVIEEINYHGNTLIFVEEDHASFVDPILADTKAKVVYINPLTTGDGAADSYLSGMWENLGAIRQVVE